MFQKCPICNGIGQNTSATGLGNFKCPTCKGERIISQITGLPPGKINDHKEKLTGIDKIIDPFKIDGGTANSVNPDNYVNPDNAQSSKLHNDEEDENKNGKIPLCCLSNLKNIGDLNKWLGFRNIGPYPLKEKIDFLLKYGLLIKTKDGKYEPGPNVKQ